MAETKIVEIQFTGDVLYIDMTDDDIHMLTRAMELEDPLFKVGSRILAVPHIMWINTAPEPADDDYDVADSVG